MKRAGKLGTSKQYQTACRLRTKLMSMLASVKSLGRRRFAGSISVLSLSGVALAKTDAASLCPHVLGGYVAKHDSCLSAFVANSWCLGVFVSKIRFEHLLFGVLTLFRISILGFRISRFCPPSSETSVNQKRAIMQNKPNFMTNQLNVSYDKSKGSENATPFLAQKSQSQFKNDEMMVSLYSTRDYENLQFCRFGKTNPNKANLVRHSLPVLRSFSEGGSDGGFKRGLKNGPSRVIFNYSSQAETLLNIYLTFYCI